MPHSNDFETYDGNSHYAQEAARREEEELAAIDEFLGDDEYDEDYDCLEDELDAISTEAQTAVA